MSDQLVVTPASEWVQGELVQLPSGRVARLQEPDLLDMLDEDGTVPDILTAIAMKKKDIAGRVQGLMDGAQNNEIAVDAEFIVDAILVVGGIAPTVTPLVRLIIQASFMEPKVVLKDPNRAKGEIALNDIKRIDQLFVAQRAIEPFLSTFFTREKPIGTVATVPNSNGNREESQSTHRVTSG